MSCVEVIANVHHQPQNVVQSLSEEPENVH